jgi:methylphosphotriester-DNA--protein-cysteine methyltransferase
MTQGDQKIPSAVLMGTNREGSGKDIPPGFLGDIRRSTPGAKRDIDHWHEDVEFDLIVRGGVTYALDDQVYVATPGTLIWLVPGQRHKMVRSPNLELWVVMFRPTLLKPSWLADLAAQPSRMISSHELIDLDRLLSQVAQDSNEADAYNAGVSYVVMRALRASRDRPPASLKPMHPAVARALLLMRQNDASSLSELAAAAGVAAPYLSRLLMEHTGRSFVDWRNRIRLDRFMQGYRPGANLLSAALDAGFGSYTRFHHIFTEIVGCPPSDWVSQVDEGKLTPQVGASAPLAAYGLPAGGGLLSARQRWTSLIPLVSPVILILLGEEFGDRLLVATPRESGALAPAFDNLDAVLSAADFEALIASFDLQDPNTAADYAQMLATHDFTQICAKVFGHFDCAPARLTDTIAALVSIIWGTSHNIEMTPAQVAAVRRQVEGVLFTSPPRIDSRMLREAYVALQCHFVIVFQAGQAARASGDQRLFDEIATVTRVWSEITFGRNLAEMDLNDCGFLSGAGKSSTRTSRTIAR